MESAKVSVKRALISVSDKQGVVQFASALHDLGVEILSTGGTAGLIAENGIPVVEVSDYTGFPEMMGGRVKTLHPKIHGGILGRRDIDRREMEDNDIPSIDLVVVNLYPFVQTVSDPDCTLENAIENIDIGGPTMLRAAAKNWTRVGVVVDADDYQTVLSDIERCDGAISPSLRYALAVKAFEHTAEYDGAIANYLGAADENGKREVFPRTFNCQFHLKQLMRYGENPHQRGAFYVNSSNTAVNVSSAVQHQGKELSYNNIADTDAAIECVTQFQGETACVIVKHANPCGVSVGESQLDAYEGAYATDPESAFGGIIAFNSPMDVVTAEAIVSRQFVEVITAPKFDPGALEVLASKSGIRVLETEGLESLKQDDSINAVSMDFKKVGGGLLVQDPDLALFDRLEVVTARAPDQTEMRDLEFAWKVAKYVKSNAIIYAAGLTTLGVGAGQMSRVNSARIAAIKAANAGLELHGAAMASDAFFPFRDGLDNAAEVGIRSVIQPGGSMRDEEVIAAADEHGIAMVFTGMRHFRH